MSPREPLSVKRLNSRRVALQVAGPPGTPQRPALVEVRYGDKAATRPVEVTLKCADGITASDMRRFGWSDAFRWADLLARELTPDPGEDTIVVPHAAVVFADPEPKPAPPKPRPGRRGHPGEHYKAVAAHYQKLVASGVRNPTAQLAAKYVVSRDTAAGWIGGARKRGYLPPARRGRAG